jgi:hypothetical protein
MICLMNNIFEDADVYPNTPGNRLKEEFKRILYIIILFRHTRAIPHSKSRYHVIRHMTGWICPNAKP